MRLIQPTPTEERPRERCLRAGSAALSIRECIALIFGSGPRGVGCMGLANQLLGSFGTDLPPEESERALFLRLEESGSASFKSIRGIGEANQAKLLAAFEIARRYSIFRERHQRVRPVKTPDLTDFAVRALDRVSDFQRSDPFEWIGFIPCFGAKQIGALCIVERGARSHVHFETPRLFSPLLNLRPTAFLLVHNHPSGDLRPSPEDQELTEKVRDLASQFGINLLGHWVVTSYSQFWIPASNKAHAAHHSIP